jgi:hypothetical protein
MRSKVRVALITAPFIYGFALGAQAKPAAPAPSPAAAQDTTKKVRLSQGAHKAKPKIMQPAPLPVLSTEQASLYEDLASRFAGDIEQIQGWYRDRPVLYYNFGDVPQPVPVAQVWWPVYGFDAAGNPVAIRGQRPIFSALPHGTGYSGLWKLTYVVTADHVRPNELRDVESVNALIKKKQVSLRETSIVLNLPIVARGSRLANDTTSGSLGWFEGRDVQYFDFGGAGATPSLMWRFSRGNDSSGAPMIVMDQNSIVDTIPVAAPAPDLWEIHFVHVDSAFVANSLKSASALQNASVVVEGASSIRNLPITVFDSKPVNRPASPLRVFADTRSPFPPAPTRPQQ